MAIYTLRTTSGREDIVADIMQAKIKSEKLDVKAILHPAELKGYLFVEGNIADIHKTVQGMLHIKSLMEKPIALSDIQHFLEVKKVKVNMGDIIEIVGGAFKGEKGRIVKVDEAKGEVTAELIEASMPIPITVATEFIKLVKRPGQEGGEKKE